jgi:hypothetical protein
VLRANLRGRRKDKNTSGRTVASSIKIVRPPEQVPEAYRVILFQEVELKKEASLITVFPQRKELFTGICFSRGILEHNPVIRRDESTVFRRLCFLKRKKQRLGGACGTYRRNLANDTGGGGREKFIVPVWSVAQNAYLPFSSLHHPDSDLESILVYLPLFYSLVKKKTVLR